MPRRLEAAGQENTMSENFLFDPLFLKVYMYTYGVVLLLIMSSFAEACLVLSPVGAVVAAVIAIRRGLGAMKYALVGLLYSMAFAIPFGYLVSRMTGGWHSAKAVWVVYVLLYLLWMCGPVAGGYILLWGVDTVTSVFLYEVSDDGFGSKSAWYIWLTLLNIISWFASLIWLIAGHFGSRPRDSILPSVYYVAPFWLAAFWSLVVYSVFIANVSAIETLLF